MSFLKKLFTPKPAKSKPVDVKKRFELIGRVGQGSMSKVYRAVDNENRRVICLKVQDLAKTTAAVARSGHAAGRLSRSPPGYHTLPAYCSQPPVPGSTPTHERAPMRRCRARPACRRTLPRLWRFRARSRA